MTILPVYMFSVEYEQLDISHIIYLNLVLLQDVRLTTTNDDSFFVFEDLLYQVSLN